MSLKEKRKSTTSPISFLMGIMSRRHQKAEPVGVERWRKRVSSPWHLFLSHPPWFLGIVKGLGQGLVLGRSPEIMSAISFTFLMGEPRPREGRGCTQCHTVSLWQCGDQHPGFHCAKWTLAKACGLGRTAGQARPPHHPFGRSRFQPGAPDGPPGPCAASAGLAHWSLDRRGNGSCRFSA